MKYNKISKKNNNSSLSNNNYYKDLFYSVIKNLYFIIPFIIIFVIFISGFMLSYFTDENYYMEIDFDKAFIFPSFKYPFGTNEFGQNQLPQVLIGCYNTLKLSIIVTFMNLFMGIIVGIVWGNNNKFDFLLLIVKSIFSNIPMIFFYIIIIYALGANFTSFLICISLFGWLNTACLIRNNLLLIRTKDYNIVSKLYKTHLYKKTINNYLPSLLPIIFSSIAFSITEVISIEVTLSYFGISISNNKLGIGKLLYDSISSNNCFSHPYLFLIPLFFLLLINISFYYLSKTISSLAIKEETNNDQSK